MFLQNGKMKYGKVEHGMAEEKLQVLVATMNQTDFSLIEKMHLTSDAIIANQASIVERREEVRDGKRYSMITTDTKGVGKNRNIALTFADSDICLLADDDMVYEKDYEEKILNAFKENPGADAIIFNIRTTGREVKRRETKKNKRVSVLRFQNYGASRIAFRRKQLQRANICFTELFGGGTIHGSGEDSLFLREMLRSGMKIYTSSVCIGTVNQENSSWFRGYNETFFYDKGCLMKAMFPRMHFLYTCFYYPFRFYLISKVSPFKIGKWMRKGAGEFKKL